MHIENVIFLILSKNAYTKFSEGPISEILEENYFCFFVCLLDREQFKLYPSFWS